MKLDKLVYSVREGLKEYSDDSDLSDRFIIYLLDIKRALLIHQKLNSFATKIPSSAVQSLCLELEDSSRYRCGIDITCDTLRRTTKPLPKVFDTVDGNSIIGVHSLDIIGKPFSIVGMELVPYLEYSTFSERVFAFLDDDRYLYMYSVAGAHKLLECVEVSAVFETPADLEDYKNCCGCEEGVETSCYTMDSEYPIPGEMITIIRDMVIQDIVKLREIPEDSENDGANTK